MESAPAFSKELSPKRKEELIALSEELIQQKVKDFVLSRSRNRVISKENNFGLTFEEKDVTFIYTNILKEIDNMGLLPAEKIQIEIHHEIIRKKLFSLGFEIRSIEKSQPSSMRKTNNIPDVGASHTLGGVNPPTSPPPLKTIGKGAAANDVDD